MLADTSWVTLPFENLGFLLLIFAVVYGWKFLKSLIGIKTEKHPTEMSEREFEEKYMPRK